MSSITEFCTRFGIKWMPGILGGPSGKIPMPIKHKAYGFKPPTTNDFANLSEDQLKERQQLFRELPELFNTIMLDTSKFMHIDIDTPEWGDEVDVLIANLPHFKSTTKAYGKHLFIKRPDDWNPPSKRVSPFIEDGVELLSGQWSYCPVNAKIIGLDEENINMMKQTTLGWLNKHARPRSPDNVTAQDAPTPVEASNVLEQIANLVSTHYRTEFDSWSKCIVSMKNSGISEDFARQWSMAVPNFTEEGFQNWWQRHYASITEGTLRYYAKASSPTEYCKLVEKERIDASDDGLAHLFLHLDCGNSVRVGRQGFRFDSRSKLWKPDDENNLLTIAIVSELKAYHKRRHLDMFNLGLSEAQLKEEQATLQKIYHKITSAKGVRDIRATVLPYLTKDIVFDKDPIHDNELSFRDGVYNVVEGTFRERTREDYYTIALNWDFNGPVSYDVCKDVESIFKQTHPEEKERQLALTWMKASLIANPVGHFKMNLGRTAANGKTGEMRIHAECFPDYTAVLPNEYFEKKCSDRHKFKYALLTQPKRAAFLEELATKNQDGNELKLFADGGQDQVKKMYGTTVEGVLEAKLMITTNNDARIDVDRGVLRRGFTQNYTSRFVPLKEDVDPSIHHYPAREHVENLFKDPQYKRAYLRLVCSMDLSKLEYLLKDATEEFADMMNDTDPVRLCIDKYFTITNQFKVSTAVQGDFVTRGDLEEVAKEAKVDVIALRGALQAKGGKWDKNSKNKDGSRGKLRGVKARDVQADIDEEEIEYASDE